MSRLFSAHGTRTPINNRPIVEYSISIRIYRYLVQNDSYVTLYPEVLPLNWPSNLIGTDRLKPKQLRFLIAVPMGMLDKIPNENLVPRCRGLRYISDSNHQL